MNIWDMLMKIQKNAVTDNNKKYYNDIEKFHKLINGLNDIVKLLGFKIFGNVDNKIIDGKTLKNIFEENK